MQLRRDSSSQGFTLPEILISVLLLALFFPAVFEVNAVCLRYIDASKENVSALQGVHDRIERLRSLAFTDLTSQSYLTTLLTTPADASDFDVRPIETVTLTDYNAGTPSVTYTRAAGASVTPTVSWSSGSSFPSTTTVIKARVSYSWNLTFSGRSRTEMTETIISDGVKK